MKFLRKIMQPNANSINVEKIDILPEEKEEILSELRKEL